MRAHHRRLLASVCAFCAAIAFPAASEAGGEHHVPGEKLDSGLGELRHYRHSADHTGRVRETVEVASRH